VYGNNGFGEGSTVMLEVDLDMSPHTLRFFVDDKEQRDFVTHIPQSINFAISSEYKGASFTVSLREVAECAGRGLLNSKSCQWGASWVTSTRTASLWIRPLSGWYKSPSSSARGHSSCTQR
jgi:hypothetical protein